MFDSLTGLVRTASVQIDTVVWGSWFVECDLTMRLFHVLVGLVSVVSVLGAPTPNKAEEDKQRLLYRTSIYLNCLNMAVSR